MIGEWLPLFHQHLGKPLDARPAGADVIERHRGRLPDDLLALWAADGFAGYGEGVVWTVNPEEFAPLLAQWLAGTRYEGMDDFHVITRSAFGLLHVWGTRTGQLFDIDPQHALILPNRFVEHEPRRDFEMESFLLSLTRDSEDAHDGRGKPLFVRAAMELGLLSPDHMYSFVPALALGGAPDFANLQRVAVLPQLEVLAQLADLEVYELSFGA